MAKRVVIVGAGAHMQDKLLPALKRLQEENKIVICALVRQDPSKGDIGLNVPVYSELDENVFTKQFVDMFVASGPPLLHKKVIDYSLVHSIRCFVEKPHLLELEDTDLYLQSCMPSSMIGYNFNFAPFLEDVDDIKEIVCGTNGLYMSWGDIFDGPMQKYLYALHSVIVHPISILVQKYGSPDSITVKDKSKEDNVVLKIGLTYQDVCRTIKYSSVNSGFICDVVTEKEIFEGKKYKAQTYYTMLDYFVTNELIEINNFTTGKNVLAVVCFVIDQLKVLASTE